MVRLPRAALTGSGVGPSLAAAATLVVAVAGWLAVGARASNMATMGMGLGPLPAFVSFWVVMMAAMMLPSAVPFISGQARAFAGRWRMETPLLIGAYLSVWALFGVAAYFAFNALGMPWPDQTRINGVALVLAALYALTPLKRACQANCRSMCSDTRPELGGAVRTAFARGLHYGLYCIGSSAGVMVVLFLLGISSLAMMAVASVLVLLYKVVPLTWRMEFAFALPLFAVGSWLMVAP